MKLTRALSILCIAAATACSPSSGTTGAGPVPTSPGAVPAGVNGTQSARLIGIAKEVCRCEATFGNNPYYIDSKCSDPNWDFPGLSDAQCRAKTGQPAAGGYTGSTDNCSHPQGGNGTLRNCQIVNVPVNTTPAGPKPQ